jgi:hypothetical protein
MPPAALPVFGDVIALGPIWLRGSASGTARAGPTTTRSWPRARRTRKRCGPSNGGSATPSTRRWWPTPGRRRRPAPRAREGNRGTSLSPGRPVHTPHTGSSGKPLPGLPPPYGPAPPQVAPQVSRTQPVSARPGTSRPLRRNPRQPLDTDSKEDSFWRR